MFKTAFIKPWNALLTLDHLRTNNHPQTMSSSIYIPWFNPLLRSDYIKSPMIFQMLPLFFVSITNTQRSLLFLCSYPSIEPTSRFPFIFNTKLHPQKYICYRNKCLYCWKPEMAPRGSSAGRASCQKIGTGLAATTTVHRLSCCSYLFLISFVLHSCLFHHSAQQQGCVHEGCHCGWTHGCLRLFL